MSRLALPCAFVPMLLSSCSDVAPARPEVVVYVDTNTPIVGLLAANPQLSHDAAIDSLHIEVLDDNAATVASEDVTAPDLVDWPVSFGVVPDEGPGQVVHLRVRAFNAAFVQATDASTLSASASVVIDRLIDIPATGGVDAQLVVLSGDCFGAPVYFATATEPAVTCIDAATPTGVSTAGVTAIGSAPPASVAGTWSAAIAQPCVGHAPPGAVCIQGGVTFLGDLALAGIAEPLLFGDSTPLRPAKIPPFFLDADEFTVKRYHEAGLPALTTGSTPGCTWVPAGDSSNDDLPLNCVDLATAAAACAAAAPGGVLPTEAEWEHAARGRGKGFTYPWGNDEPVCCSADYGGTGSESVCPGGNVAPVGSHVSPDGCSGPHDVTPDGVADMAGNLSEWTSDVYGSYAGPCWAQPIQTNPTCTSGSSEQTLRGGNWQDGVIDLRAAVREFAYPSDSAIDTGFRCAYPGTGP